ncbi:cytochrome P450 [Actinomadura sp. NPDC047616]|uniref:cytochrome P450 n=1 Tax=Actinomadura sp. NPDC047616 TaxID=3155914 RepID=UPI0033EFFD98
MPRRCPFSPPPEYERLRAAGPLARVSFLDGPVWVVTRQAEARRLLTDPRFSTDPSTPGHPLAGFAGSADEQAGQFLDMDPPEHGRYRRMVIPDFSVKRVREMRPRIQRVVDRLVDDMLRGDGADLVTAFGLPLASLMICQILGVPYEDHDYFHRCTRRIAEASGEGAEQETAAARTELITYLGTLVDRAARHPGDDIVSRLATTRLATGELSRDELVGIAFLLLVAGHQTTANMLPLGVFTLLSHPAQLADLTADPGLWPGAVEELLRFHSVVDWAAFDRVATEDVELGGQVIRAGEGIFVLGASANRDELVYERPDEFDVHRGTRHHLAFGYGFHQCLGQHLARAELEIGLRTLFERIPSIRLAVGPDELPFKYENRTFGLYRLPVTW